MRDSVLLQRAFMPVYIEKSGDLGKKNIINGAGNSDELRTQNCPPKGISRAGNSDIHHKILHLFRKYQGFSHPYMHT